MKFNIILNSVGLIFNVIGAILLFKFGLPENINREGHINLILEQEDEGEKRKAQKYDFWGKTGLVFIIIGFIFQLIGSLI